MMSTPISSVVTTTRIKPDMKGARTPAHAKTPPYPWIIGNTESPSRRARVIIIGANPGMIVITGSVDNGWTIDITSCISRGIAHINNIGCRIINIHIFCIVYRA
jgi:hypothetical protein